MTYIILVAVSVCEYLSCLLGKHSVPEEWDIFGGMTGPVSCGFLWKENMDTQLAQKVPKPWQLNRLGFNLILCL